jgi:hypothetical protein
VEQLDQDAELFRAFIPAEASVQAVRPNIVWNRGYWLEDFD